MARLKVAAIVAACCVSVACGSTPPTRNTTPSPSPTVPAPDLAAWADGYCNAIKDLTLAVYTLPSITTEADLPKAATALESLDTELGTAITALEKLPDLAAPAQEANAVVSDRLTFYRDLHDQVTEYRALLPRGGLDYAQSAFTVLGIDMVSYDPATYASDVPGMREAMKANKDCELVS